MNISHVAIWVSDLELMRRFYQERFHATVGKKYENPRKQFESYFLSFDSGARLELMRKKGIGFRSDAESLADFVGLSHIAVSVGSEASVDKMTKDLAEGGVTVLSPPRHTGDGYYESVVSDPEGNVIEITV